LTNREAMNWWFSDAIRNTVSTPPFSLVFIAAIWNSYSKSETARRPLRMIVAPTSSTKCMSRLANGRTRMRLPSPLRSRDTSSSSISTRSSRLNSGPLPAFTATPMTS